MYQIVEMPVGLSVRRIVDGVIIPADPNNADFAEYQIWRDAGNEPAPIPVVPPSANGVRAEASRRMQTLTGARNAADLEIKIANASREAIRLLRKGPANWTDTERARADALERVDMAIEAIRAASNRLETAPPADFADNKYWPRLT